MSASHDNSAQPCDHRAPCPQPVAPQAAEDRPADAPPRPGKASLLPEIARLALEGHSGRAIGRKLGVPRRTVDRWLGQLRRQWAQSAAESGGELFAVAMARLEAVYREAMEAWRRSLGDQQVTVEALGSDGAAEAKGSLRKTTQSGQAALLGKAIHAAREISKFHAQHLDCARQAQETERSRVRRDLADELHGLPKEVFRELKELLRQGCGGAPPPQPSELAKRLSNLTAEEYRKLAAALRSDSERELPPRGRLRGEG